MTLDEAIEAYEEDPTLASLRSLIQVALAYEKDEMIDTETLIAILAKTYSPN